MDDDAMKFQFDGCLSIVSQIWKRKKWKLLEKSLLCRSISMHSEWEIVEA
jgi:hypothetical protein